jgi:hypothetical protein
LKAWGGILHDEDFDRAIVDRVPERGASFGWDGTPPIAII